MREPMVRRGRLSRQQRLLRTGIGAVVVVAIAALIANALGGGGDTKNPGGKPLAQVAFQRVVRGTSDGKTADKAAVAREADAIVGMLNGWYQTAFVDTSKFGDGTFGDIQKLFVDDAKASFKRDVKSLAIGDSRTRAARVDPKQQRVTVTVFMADGKTPTYATALVRFMAVVTQKQAAQPKIRITQRASLHLEKIDGTWRVTYYSANETEKPVAPAPSASPTT